MTQPTGTPTSLERTETWKAEYDFTVQVTLTFYEWRHKILIRYAVAVSALVIASKYLYENRMSLWLQLTPYAAGVFFSWYFLMADRIHTKILDDCYVNGMRLENEVNPSPLVNGLFTLMRSRVNAKGRERWLSYRRLLKVLFGTGIVAFIVGGACVAAFGRY